MEKSDDSMIHANQEKQHNHAKVCGTHASNIQGMTCNNITKGLATCHILPTIEKQVK